MRIGIVAEQLRRAVPGGIGTYVRGLVAGLGALEGEDVAPVLIASRPKTRPDPLAALGLPLQTSPLPQGPMRVLWDWGLPLRPVGLGLVHATSLAVPAVPGVPVVACVHDTAWRRVPGAFGWRGRRWHEAALGRAMQRARRFVVPSAETAEDLVEAGAPEERIRVVAEGCDHLPPPDRAAAGALLARLGVPGEYLLSVGTIEPRKNLSRLVAAYTLARRRLPEPWPLVVVGPRGWGDAAAGLGAEGVVLAGEVPGAVLSALYAGSRLVAYVPLWEGWGLPAVEAMGAGALVVASPMPSTGGAALQVDPLDTEAIADGLVRAGSDEALRSRLAGAGAERARSLTWRATAAAHLEVWRELAS